MFILKVAKSLKINHRSRTFSWNKAGAIDRGSIRCCQRRSLSSQSITRNLDFYTEKPRQIVIDTKSLRSVWHFLFSNSSDREIVTLLFISPSHSIHFSRLRQASNGKSLAVVLSWFQAKSKHLEKYCELYTDLGFDVLVLRAQMLQFMRPATGTQVITGDVLKFLANNESYERIALHGFSMGGYLWAECLVQLRENEKYHSIEQRIKGQVWDSIGSIQDIPTGVSKAIFPKNVTLQRLVKNFIGSYLERSEQTVTKHYSKATRFFHHQAIDAPTLMFYSKIDPIGTVATNEEIAGALKACGLRVTTKVFEDSPHVGHLQKHREDYLKYLMDHLKSCDLIAEKKE